MWGARGLVLPGIQERDWRRARLFGPIVALTLGVLGLLVLLSFFLVERFDKVASDREVTMVRYGFSREVGELNQVVATQVEWDDAIASLDRKRDFEWADFNVGSYLYTFHGISHAFVIDPEGQAFYAALNGERAAPESYAPFAAPASRLIPAIRSAEARRPPLRERAGKNNIDIPSIQANTVA
ncbi:MAG TPA: CHASE4 domain-containing protein, partial [Novosphingobium sp.]|nr:CHASE4 domain-containing protein [Novosphingobium sp.]